MLMKLPGRLMSGWGRPLPLLSVLEFLVNVVLVRTLVAQPQFRSGFRHVQFALWPSSRCSHLPLVRLACASSWFSGLSTKCGMLPCVIVP